MDTKAAALVRALELLPHPEGGFYRESFRAPLVLDGLPHGAGRAASTAIYYLLPAGARSLFHRVRSDELWHFYAGEPLELHLVGADGTHTAHVLGRDIEGGERPQIAVPAGTLQAAAPLGRFTLCGCTVAPGFDFADWELMKREVLTARYPEHAALFERLAG